MDAVDGAREVELMRKPGRYNRSVVIMYEIVCFNIVHPIVEYQVSFRDISQT